MIEDTQSGEMNMRVQVFYSTTRILLLSLALASCNLFTSTQSTPPPTESIPGMGEENTPSIVNLATKEQPLKSSSGASGDLEPSPSYGVYVGMDQTGFCSPTTNSGWFSGFQFDSAFQNVQFVPPGPENPFPNGGFYSKGSIIPMQSVHGEGDILSFSICPSYDGVANSNSVNMGPKRFEPSLQILMGEDLPAVPIVGDTGPHVAILYDMGSAVGGGSILEWESSISKGILGSPNDRFSIVFSVGWNSIMAGKAFEVGAEYQDEGETQVWTLRFVPQDQ
jgi:hypothetical protein